MSSFPVDFQLTASGQKLYIRQQAFIIERTDFFAELRHPTRICLTIEWFR